MQVPVPPPPPPPPAPIWNKLVWFAWKLESIWISGLSPSLFSLNCLHSNQSMQPRFFFYLFTKSRLQSHEGEFWSVLVVGLPPRSRPVVSASLHNTPFIETKLWMGTVYITSWYSLNSVFNGSHFSLSPPAQLYLQSGLGGERVWTMTYAHRPHFVTFCSPEVSQITFRFRSRARAAICHAHALHVTPNRQGRTWSKTSKERTTAPERTVRLIYPFFYSHQNAWFIKH